MLYTHKGDSGTSELLRTTSSLPKYHELFEALGTLDELNSLLGFCRAKTKSDSFSEVDITTILLEAQKCLFIIQAELAGAKGKSVTTMQVREIETVIDTLEKMITRANSFVIPGEIELSALCDFARAVARRAERRVCILTTTISPSSLAYLNRLSSLLYALARFIAKESNTKEMSPTY